MAIDDTRYYQTFYGLRTEDWASDFGGLADHNTFLVKDYLSDAVSCPSKTPWTSSGTKFLYPHRIKKTYFIEGVVEGHITFSSVSNSVHGFLSSWVSDYRVTISKMHNDTTETELATTGVIAVNDSFATIGGVETERVYPFWIDVNEPKALNENERILLKIEWDIDNSSSITASLTHWNDSSTEDIKIILPFAL